MTRNRFLSPGSALLFALAAQVAVAQQSSVLHGTVRTPDGKPLPGIKVILDSPAIFNQRVVLTDGKGEWHAPLLPVGTYKVTAARDGFNAATRSAIRVGLGSDVRVDLVLAPIQSATVEVVSVPGTVVDKTEVNAGANFSAELQYELPMVDRSFYGALDMTPGADLSTDGSNYVIRGGSTTYTNYRVNGAEVKDDYANGLGATWVIDDNIEDTQVVTSQVNVRFGRGLGGSVNVVTKSGGNEFEGSARVKLARDDWHARTPDTLPGSVWDDNLNREYDLTFRGPILKDRLWFAVGTILKPNQSYSYAIAPFPATANAPMQTGLPAVDALLNAGPGAGYSLATFDNGKGYLESFDSSYYEGKLTGAITADHTLELSFVKQNQTYQNGDPSGSALSLASLCSSYQDYRMESLNYKGILGPATFLEGRLTTSKTILGQQTGNPAYGGQEGVYVEYGQAGAPENGLQAQGLPFGFPLGATPEDHGNYSGDLNFKLLREWHGTHDLDLGVEYFDSYTDNGEDWGSQSRMFFVGGAYANPSGNLLFPVVNYTPGQNYMYFDAAGHQAYGAGPVVREAMGAKGRASCTQLGAYVNDAWTVNANLMFGAGLRMDTNKAIDVDGHYLAKSSDPTCSFLARWDPKGDSSHLVTFTASQSAGNFNQALFGQFTAKKTTVEIDRGWSANTVDPGAGSASQAVQWVDYATLTNPANYGNVISFLDQSQHNVLAPDLRPPTVQELTLGYKRSYADQSRVGLTLVHRRWRNLWAQSYDFAPQFVINVADPSHSGLPSMQDVTPRWSNSNDLTRQYNGLEVEFTKHFSPRWSMQGSYTYSRLTGNCEDGDYGAWGGWRLNDSVAGTPTWNALVLNKMGLTPNDYGPSGTLSNNQSQKARLALLHTLPVGKDGHVTLSIMAHYDSGKSWSARSYAPIDQSKYPAAMAAYPNLGVTPSLTYFQYYSKYGAYNDNDMYSCDFKATWDVPVKGWKVHFIGDTKITNLFNVTMPMTTYHQFVNDSSNGSGQLLLQNPSNWGSSSVTGYQPFYNPGRTATFSCGFRF